LASSDAKLNTINQPYHFELELISERPDLDLQSLLHQPAFLAFPPDGLGIHGQIYQVAQGESGKRLTRYRTWKTTTIPAVSWIAAAANT
jgi:type VI secretion system secreted protein VgrG